MNRTPKRVVIAGAGPAGYTAAIYCARAGFEVKIIAGPMPGGQLTTTLHIENYPGVADTSAATLIATMLSQCKNLGVRVLHESATQLNTSPISVVTKANTHAADAVIVATGANSRLLNVEGEERLFSKGISTCAVCDGHFFKGRKMAVIGGGNTAAEEAIYLTGLASKVYLIHRRDSLRAEHTLRAKLFRLEAEGKIEFWWSSRVHSFAGTEHLQSIQIITPDGMQRLEVSAAFVCIGHIPNTSWCSNVLDTDDAGYLRNAPLTNVPGVFSAGDVCDAEYRQAITAAGQGCMAALKAISYLQ